MINKFWKMMDRFFLLMIEVTRENEMPQVKNPPDLISSKIKQL